MLILNSKDKIIPTEVIEELAKKKTCKVKDDILFKLGILLFYLTNKLIF